MTDKETKEIDIAYLFKLLWKERKKVIKWGIYGAVIGLIIAFSIPKEYTSVAKIVPEVQTKQLGGSAGALADMMGVSNNNSVDAINEDIYPEVIKSTPFVLELADIEVNYDGETMLMSDYMLENQSKAWWSYIFSFPGQVIGWTIGLFTEKSDTLTIKNSPKLQQSFKSILNKSIEVNKDKKLGIITIESSFQDPKIAKLISDSVIVKLQNYMVKYRTAKIRSGLESNVKMLETAKSNYYKAEQDYAEAVDKNKNLISQVAMVKLDRLFNERTLTFQIYSQIAGQVESDRVKLEDAKSIAAVIEPSNMPVRASSPNKMLILIAFTFIGGLIMVIRVVIKDLF